MATPVWLGATSGQGAAASQVNQFLGAHASTFLYTGASFASQSTAGSGAANSNGLYIAQSFATGTTTASGRAFLTVAVTGSPGPLTLGIYANSGGAPSGAALVATVVPPSLFTGSPVSTSIPLPYASLTTSTTYWVVATAVGDVSDFYSFSKSNQVSGASTSTNGTSWTAQSYGLLYSVFNQAATGALVHTWEDSGVRWTTFATNGNGTPSSLIEYTVAQGSGQYVYSSRAFTYSGSTLTKIA